jgi:hypothetical protein
MSSVRSSVAAAAGVARHPSLWWTALVQARRLTPRAWWRHRPFLPVPDAAYLRFRMQTMYGDADHVPEPADVVTYLRWCRSFSRIVADTADNGGK